MDGRVTVAGEELLLMPEKAVYWPSQKTLFVADVHLGKAAAMRAAAIPIPETPTYETLDRLSHAVCRTGADRLIVLGDLWHARQGRQPETVRASIQWRQAHPYLEVILVEGNHDRRSGDLPEEFRCEVWQEPTALGPFSLCHYPDVDATGYKLAGHVHPGARLEGRGRRGCTLPCFWVGADCMVLPAFGAFTGFIAVRPREGDRLFVMAEGRVLEPATTIRA